MPDRSRKHPPTDPNELAAYVVAEATGEPTPVAPAKDPAAVALGRKGGLKGGKARSEALTPERRREIAKAAAAKRWEKREGPE